MPSKVVLSKDSSSSIASLSQKIGLRRNIICRLAISESLKDPSSVKSLEPEDSEGFEFNRYTLTGEKDNIFKALIVQHEGEKLGDEEYLKTYVRNHIERGADRLKKEYSKCASDKEFLKKLVPKEGI